MRTLICCLTLVLGCLCWGTSSARADSWAPPKPFIVANGQFAFKVIPNKLDAEALKKALANPDERDADTQARLKKSSVSRGVLFTLDADGRDKVLWERDLVNRPLDVHLSGDGSRVVTLNSHHNVGGPHSVVVYDQAGEVLADYDLKDLLTEEEILTHVRRTVSSAWWTDDAEVGINHAWNRLVIRLSWGKPIKVDLDNGKLLLPGDAEFEEK